MRGERVRRSISFELLRYANEDAELQEEDDDDPRCADHADCTVKKIRRRRKRGKKCRGGALQHSLSLGTDAESSALVYGNGFGPQSSAFQQEGGLDGGCLVDVEEQAASFSGESGLSQLSSSAVGDEVDSTQCIPNNGVEHNGVVEDKSKLQGTLSSVAENDNSDHRREEDEHERSSDPSCRAHVLSCSPLLRQRAVSSSVVETEKVFSRSSSKTRELDAAPAAPPPFDLNGAHNVDWKQVMTIEPSYLDVAESSPFQYVFDELRGGTSLEITTRAGDEQSRERVYNVLFHVPWRCELLIDVGFFVCLDSFLSLLTVMPVRLFLSLWSSVWQLRALKAEDFCDLGCLVILLVGVLTLTQADISYIYHSIRFEPNIKLYVIYNMLEVFDKLFQSFGVDVLEVLFNSAVTYANSAPDNFIALLRLGFDQLVAVLCFILHSFIILSEAITISAALQHASTNKSLLVLLMSNNFAEIKSNVFKRFSKDNMHNLAHRDTVERFHILVFLFFVFVQNIMIAEGPWMGSFLYNAAMVILCEAFVDLLKHSFLSKFNRIQPAAYSEFLKSLCEQVMSSRRRNAQKALHFVPLGPACVVIRVLIPLYGAYVSSHSCWKNWLWSGVLAIGTFAFLAASKIVVGFSLRTYAAWHLRRCHYREMHHHAD